VQNLLVLREGTDVICRQSNRVYASSCVFTMFKKTKKPAACEMRSVIRFLNARNMKPADIHRQLCEAYREHAGSDSMVRRWARHFIEGRENVHDDSRSGRPPVVNEDLVRAVKEKVQENRLFTISLLSLHFPQISRSLLHEIVSDKLRGLYHRRHHSTIQGYKNWCPATTSASTMVGTMSKSSVRYVHQTAK
jgi:transposase